MPVPPPPLPPTAGAGPLDLEGTGVPEAHVRGIDLAYRAPDLHPEDRAVLPEPILDGRKDWVDLYWRAWAVAFDKVRQPRPGSGFVSAYVDEGFSNNIFQWDTCFMICFARYAAHRLPVGGTLDNFYAKQHADGFICREIDEVSGADFWPASHPSAINPPLFAWAEWEMFQVTGDRARLRRVLPLLERYHAWLRIHRRHADGAGYWTTALASGMDNTPRVFEHGGDDAHAHYGYAWLCMTAQQALDARMIACIADAVGEAGAAAAARGEYAQLARYLNEAMWDEAAGFYFDRTPGGTLARVRTPAACWPVLAGVASPDRADRIARHLFDPAAFWRPHAVPSLSADHPYYHPRGNYWQGGVWAPLVYLAIRALEAAGRHDGAVRIAENHLANVAAVYEATGTFWESYAPESAAPGNIARPEFVGWTGCGPVASLLETVIGIRVEAPARRVAWNLARRDRHGIRNLRMGDAVVSLLYEPGEGARGAADGAADGTIEAEAGADFELTVRMGRRTSNHRIPTGACTIRL